MFQLINTRFRPFVAILILAGSLTLSMVVAPTTAFAATIRIPQDQPTIQAGINAAKTGDVVLVAPGTYHESVKISGKRITLASYFYTTGDRTAIDQTIIDGNGLAVDSVIYIAASAAGSEFIGFTVQNGNDGIAVRTQASVVHNKVRNMTDGIDIVDGGGIIQDNILENNKDDGIDINRGSYGIVENNFIRNNDGDGIELRLHDYTGPRLTITIRSNTLANNLSDGIQLIDYPSITDRVFYIERNLIQANNQAGLGLMDGGSTHEDFRGASIPERIHVYNNTFSNNLYGLTGGDNLIALNNIFMGTSVLAMKNVDAQSVAAYNLFWENGTHYQNSNIDQTTTLFADPLLDATFRLNAGSPAIDAGTAHYEHNGEVVLDYPATSYAGSAPDLGWDETNLAAPPTLTPTNGPTSTPTPSPSSNLLANSSFEADTNQDGKPDVWSTSSKFLRSNGDGIVTPIDGAFLGRFRATDNSGATIKQTVSASAGTAYTFACSANIPATADGFTYKFQVQWKDASNSTISTWTVKTYLDDTNGAWNAAAGSKIAPVGTSQAIVMLKASSLNGTIYVDACELRAQ